MSFARFDPTREVAFGQATPAKLAKPAKASRNFRNFSSFSKGASPERKNERGRQKSMETSPDHAAPGLSEGDMKLMEAYPHLVPCPQYGGDWLYRSWCMERCKKQEKCRSWLYGPQTLGEAMEGGR